MSEFNIYFESNPVKGNIWIRSLPTQFFLGAIEERIGVAASAPGLMRRSMLCDFDPKKLADMDHHTFEELRYVDIT